MERIRYYKRIVIASAVFAVLLAVSVAFPCAYARWVSGAETNVIGGTIGIASGTSKPQDDPIDFDGDISLSEGENGYVNAVVYIDVANKTLTLNGYAKFDCRINCPASVSVQTVRSDYVFTFTQTGSYMLWAVPDEKMIIIVPQ